MSSNYYVIPLLTDRGELRVERLGTGLVLRCNAQLEGEEVHLWVPEQRVPDLAICLLKLWLERRKERT